MKFASFLVVSQAAVLACSVASGTQPTSINIPAEVEYLRGKSGQSRNQQQTTKCIRPLGCFSVEGEWSKRSANLLPADRSTIGTAFLLFTRLNPQRPQVLQAENASSISKSNFVATKQTKLVVHGYLTNSEEDWIRKLNAELLLHGDYNVINVDWGGLSGSMTWYTQAVANIRVVGAEMALLINALKVKAGSTLESVHIIGHSLGAHAAGYAGQQVKGIGRVTGLDPAGPYFEGYSADMRLDPTDAVFVDVIHTDGDSLAQMSLGSGGFGLMQASGHADFYPNGGKDQPGCSFSSQAGLLSVVTCDHSRSIELFTCSINGNCSFAAYKCGNYSEFVNAKCSLSCDSSDLSSGRCNKLGLPALKPKESTSLSYYGYTSGAEPFCATSYTAVVAMDPRSNSVAGKLYLSLKWKASATPFTAISDGSIELKAGRTYSHVINSHRQAGAELVGVNIKWQPDVRWWDITSQLCAFLNLCSSDIMIKKLEIKKENASSITFCSTGIQIFKDSIKRLTGSPVC